MQWEWEGTSYPPPSVGKEIGLFWEKDRIKIKEIVREGEGVQYGRIDAQVQKVLVCWMATRNALENAGKIGCDLVIAHESLYYPYDAAVRKDNPAGWQEWRTNRQRSSLLGGL